MSVSMHKPYVSSPIIVLTLKALEGRGAERAVTILSRVFAKMGCQVHVLCLEPTIELLLDEGVAHHVIDYNKIKFKLRLNRRSKYKAIAAEIDNYINQHIGIPDLILVNIYKLNWIMTYSKLPNIVNVLHTALSMQFAQDLEKSPTKIITHLREVYGAHPCICVSEGARKDMIELIGDVTTTKTIYNPCDAKAIQHLASQPLKLSDYELKSKQYIIHVGSFDSMKGHHDLLEAYAKTSRQFPLVLVGKGKLENEIKELANKLGIFDSVKFLGFQSNPYPFIKHAALLVLSSKFEGFGYVIVEAQALGVPVISTNCPFGPRELLPLLSLVDLNDQQALSELIEDASRHPQAYLTSLDNQLLPDRVAQEYLKFGQIELSS